MTGTQTNLGDSPDETPINLGVLTFTDGFIPVKIVLSYAAGCAISTNQTIECWGSNGNGEVGLEVADAYITTPSGPVDLGNDFLVDDLAMHSYGFLCIIDK